MFRSRWSGWELTRTMWTATSPWPSSPSTCSWWTATPPTTTRLPTPASSCGCADVSLDVSSFPDYTLKQFSSHKHLQDLPVFGSFYMDSNKIAWFTILPLFCLHNKLSRDWVSTDALTSNAPEAIHYLLSFDFLLKYINNALETRLMAN